MDLLIDIKCTVAGLSQEAWINLVFYDPEFKKYAYTDEGRRKFIELFTNITKTKEKTEYYLFGKLNSIGGSTGNSLR